MNSPRDQEIVSWWGWGGKNLVFSRFFAQRDHEIISWWGWGQGNFYFFKNSKKSMKLNNLKVRTKFFAPTTR